MAIFRELRRQARQIVVSLLGISVIGYFAFHAIEGEHGLRSYFAVKHRIELAHAERDAARAERSVIERRVSALRPTSLDLDMLDERARQVLNLVHEEDFVIQLPLALD
ncbi:MAG: septum formation initiator family protein [Alphaproteobacteria bacterium]|nr:septum formation initiator family protein [Alphaproteobacteria bacterium]